MRTLHNLLVLALLATALAPSAAADHGSGVLDPDGCSHPNLLVNLVLGAACLTWNDGGAPLFHIAIVFTQSVAQAVLDACEAIHGEPCT